MPSQEISIKRAKGSPYPNPLPTKNCKIHIVGKKDFEFFLVDQVIS